MNFIVIISDTLRRDHLGCYGNSWISTPHIDAFAERAIIFDRAYSASFPTVPHRRDVLTGRYTFTYTPWAPLSSDERVLAQDLGQAGYLTSMIADCPHILENGYHYDRGFEGLDWIRGQESDRTVTHPREPALPCDPDKLRGGENSIRHHRRIAATWRYEEDHFAPRTMASACKWLEDNYRERPFFLYVDTFDPHEPWDAPPWYVDMYDPGYTGQVVDYPRYDYVDFLTPEELKHCRAMYAAEVTMVDRAIGRLLEVIADMQLLEDTVVLVTTDHGFLHGEHGIIGKGLIRKDRPFRYIPLWEEINHIPWLMHVPGVTPHHTGALVQPPDIFPTFLELAGIAVPDTVNGQSFAPVLRGESDVARKFAVSSQHILAGGNAGVQATVVKGRWAGILGGVPIARLDDKAVDGISKTTEIDKEPQPDLLYDLHTDPTQQRNVATEFPEVLRELRADYLSLLRHCGTEKALIEPWEIL